MEEGGPFDLPRSRLVTLAVAVLPRRSLAGPERRGAGGPGLRLAVLPRRHHPLHPRGAGAVLAGEVRERRDEGRVVLDLVEHDLVEGVAIGVPGVDAVLPVEGADPESRRAVAD